MDLSKRALLALVNLTVAHRCADLVPVLFVELRIADLRQRELRARVIPTGIRTRTDSSRRLSITLTVKEIRV